MRLTGGFKIQAVFFKIHEHIYALSLVIMVKLLRVHVPYDTVKSPSDPSCSLSPIRPSPPSNKSKGSRVWS